MKLIAQLKLRPTAEQADALRRTLEAANGACNFISDVAWEMRTFGKFALQKACYEQVREQFGLSAQMTIRALAKVGDAYKLDKKAKRTFRPLASIAYDDRILSFALPRSEVSIWTLEGRQAISFVCGERQRRMLATRQGESDLLLHRGGLSSAVSRVGIRLPPMSMPQSIFVIGPTVRRPMASSLRAEAQAHALLGVGV